MSFDLLDQAFRLHAVQVREIFIEHHLPITTTKMRFSIAGAATSSSEAVFSVTRTIRPAWQADGSFCLRLVEAAGIEPASEVVARRSLQV